MDTLSTVIDGCRPTAVIAGFSTQLDVDGRWAKGVSNSTYGWAIRAQVVLPLIEGGFAAKLLGAAPGTARLGLILRSTDATVGVCSQRKLSRHARHRGDDSRPGPACTTAHRISRRYEVPWRRES